TTHYDLVTNNANQSSSVTKNITDRNGNPLSFKDSRCVWFSLNRLKQFICYIQNYSEVLQLNQDSLGIRFYYAVYPGSEELPDFPKNEYKDRFGQHTVYLIPTYEVQNQTIDFDPLIS